MSNISGMFQQFNNTLDNLPSAQRYDESIPGMTPSPLDKTNPLIRNMIRSGAGMLGMDQEPYLSSPEKAQISNVQMGSAVKSQDPKELMAAGQVLMSQGRTAEAIQMITMGQEIQTRQNAAMEKEAAAMDDRVKAAKKDKMRMSMAQIEKDPQIKEMIMSGAVDPEEYAASKVKARTSQKPVVVGAGGMVIMPDGTTKYNPKDAPEKGAETTKLVKHKDGSSTLIYDKGDRAGEVIKEFGVNQQDDADTSLAKLVKYGGVKAYVTKAINTLKDNPLSTGGWGSFAFSKLPYSQARALEEQLLLIKSNVGFDALTDLKAQGGNLGQIAIMELQALQGSLVGLDPLSPNLQDNLKELEDYYERAMRLEAGEDMMSVIDWSRDQYKPFVVSGPSGNFARIDGKYFPIELKKRK